MNMLKFSKSRKLAYYVLLIKPTENPLWYFLSSIFWLPHHIPNNLKI